MQNTPTIVDAGKFRDAHDLGMVLLSSGWTQMYIEDSHGNHITKFRVREEKLTDGSLVYTLVLL